MIKQQVDPQDFTLAFLHHHDPHENSLDQIKFTENNDQVNSVGGKVKAENKNAQKKQRKKKEGSVGDNKKSGHWSYQQNKKYHLFLEIYNQHFLNKHMRRTDKIFKIMQTFLGTREAEQCRSHHQKMQKKHKSFQSILLHLRHQFYGTQDHNPIAQDLANINIDFSDGLVNAEVLRKNEEHNIKQEYEANNMKFPLLQQQSKAIQNIFSDRYEHHMDFNHFLN